MCNNHVELSSCLDSFRNTIATDRQSLIRALYRAEFYGSQHSIHFCVLVLYVILINGFAKPREFVFS